MSITPKHEQKIWLKTVFDYHTAIALTLWETRWPNELKLREWLYFALKSQIDEHIHRAIAARYRLGVELLRDETE